jgi:hypothetical protein
MFKLFPDPGVIPTLPAPKVGELITINVDGLPPYKDVHFSIRNPRHPHYERFVKLRDTAVKVMNGRCWLVGPVRLRLIVFGDMMGKTLTDYVSGIEDTLDGSHGEQFTYLLIVFQDDAQICEIESERKLSEQPHYTVIVEAMADEQPG